MISYGLQILLFAQSFNYLLINDCKEILMSNFVRIINSSMNKLQSIIRQQSCLFLIVI